MRDATEAEWLEGTDYDSMLAETRARVEGPPDPEPPPACSCVPCKSPANGAPGIAHCMACCAGSLIEEYDHECPVEDHREMAVAQFGPEPGRGPEGTSTHDEGNR